MAGKRSRHHKVHKVATKMSRKRKTTIHGGFKAMEHKDSGHKKGPHKRAAAAGSVHNLGHPSTTDAAGRSAARCRARRCASARGRRSDGASAPTYADHRKGV